MQKTTSVLSARPTLYVSIRYRMLVIFIVLHTLSYILGGWWLYNYMTRLAGDMLADGQVRQIITSAQAEQILATLQARIRDVAIPVYIVSFIVLFGILYFISFRVSRPLAALTRFAEQVAEGDYTPVTIPALPHTRDEVSTLSEVFGAMVGKVREREETLKQKIIALEVKVDEAKRTKEVSDIVDSEFFSKLKDQAKEIRARGSADSPKADT